MPGSPVDAALGKLASAGRADHQRAAARRSRPSSARRTRACLTSTGDYLEEHRARCGSARRTRSRARRWRRSSARRCRGPRASSASTTVLAFVIGTLLGVYAGWRRGQGRRLVGDVGRDVLRARSRRSGSACCCCTVLAFKYGWFPIKGGYDRGHHAESRACRSSATRRTTACCPALTLAITTLSGWVFGMRNNMINTLGEDYVTFAEANGLRCADRRAALRGAQRLAAQRHRVRPGAGRGDRRVGPRRGRLQLPGRRQPALPGGDQPRLPADAGAVPGHHAQHAGRDLRRRPALRPPRPAGARRSHERSSQHPCPPPRSARRRPPAAPLRPSAARSTGTAALRRPGAAHAVEQRQGARRADRARHHHPGGDARPADRAALADRDHLHARTWVQAAPTGSAPPATARTSSRSWSTARGSRCSSACAPGRWPPWWR